MRFLAVLLVLTLVAGLSHADVIPEGSHSVSYSAYIDNLDEYGDYQLFVYPTAVSGGIAFMDSSLIPGHYKFAPARLYAVPKSQLPPNGSLTEPPEGALSVEAPGHSGTLPDSDTRTEIVEHFRLSIKDGSMTLEKVDGGSGCDEKQECPAPAADYALPALALGGGLAVGLAAGYLAGRSAGR